MSEWELNNFTRDLSSFNKLIEKYDLPISLTQLSSLESKLQNAISLDFSIIDIEFNIFETMAGTIPNGLNMFSIFFSHNFFIDARKDKSKQDPFVSDNGYSFRINIVGYKDNSKEQYHYCLRLDRHVSCDVEPKVCHPFYHFHFGGDELSSMGTGELLVLASPRIAHPPMDLFLGIHFILGSFFNRKSHPMVAAILKDDEYCRIITNAQLRLWTPYFKAFSDGYAHEDYTKSKVFPLFI